MLATGYNEEGREMLTRIEESLVFAVQGLDVRWHDTVLVTGATKVLAEAAARCVEAVDFPIWAETVGWSQGRGFGLEALGCSNCGDVGARRRERCQELCGVLSIVGNAK